ncbi:MAG: choice-of-anchor Q domain-containing protein, partial [Planctomycetota bacterium]
MKTTAIMSVLVVFFLSFAGAASARVIKVPLEYASVQEAIDAGIAGDEVVVSPGTYGSVNFSGKALTVRSIDPNDPSIVAGTVIDAGAVGSAVTFASGEGRDSVLAGFTITGGTGTCLEVYNWDGGGVYCYNSSPTITSNVISGNRCPPPELWENGRGGGIFCWQSQALIDRNIIRGNEAVFGGGLISQESNDLVTNNVIHGNTGEIGGGVLVYGGRFVNNTVADNFAWWEAGNVGVGMSPAVPRALIANNIICFGWAQRGGGILWYGTVEYDNIVNNNVWDNAGEDYSGLPNQTGQNGNISEDPLFADPSIRDYHLRFDSPCINAGDAAFLPGGVGRDIDGEPRVFCTRVDIGADEYTGELKAVADAGVDQSFKEIVQVSLDGSGSYSCDPCGVPEFQWSQTSGPAV